LGIFEDGLYGCSEMCVNGFMQLIRVGIIRREAFGHLGLPQLFNERKIGVLPDFPFGTDFTDDEVVIVKDSKNSRHSPSIRWSERY
jgi:hypothetical protein